MASGPHVGHPWWTVLLAQLIMRINYKNSSKHCSPWTSISRSSSHVWQAQAECEVKQINAWSDAAAVQQPAELWGAAAHLQRNDANKNLNILNQARCLMQTWMWAFRLIDFLFLCPTWHCLGGHPLYFNHHKFRPSGDLWAQLCSYMLLHNQSLLPTQKQEKAILMHKIQH